RYFVASGDNGRRRFHPVCRINNVDAILVRQFGNQTATGESFIIHMGRHNDDLARQESWIKVWHKGQRAATRSRSARVLFAQTSQLKREERSKPLRER